MDLDFFLESAICLCVNEEFEFFRNGRPGRCQTTIVSNSIFRHCTNFGPDAKWRRRQTVICRLESQRKLAGRREQETTWVERRPRRRRKRHRMGVKLAFLKAPGCRVSGKCGEARRDGGRHRRCRFKSTVGGRRTISVEACQSRTERDMPKGICRKCRKARVPDRITPQSGGEKTTRALLVAGSLEGYSRWGSMELGELTLSLRDRAAGEKNPK
jgi:hypothetical protein